jgi:AcrR family transcriptional regulator
MARKIDPAKRASILNAGRVIFLRDGFASAKMSDIAQEAGVAPGTVYLYFDSKEDLGTAIGEDFFCELSNGFAQVIKKLDKPSGIKDLVEWALRIGTEERDLLALIKMQLPQKKPDCEDGPRSQFLRTLAQALERLQANEHARQYDSFALASVVMCILQGLIMTCVFSATDTEQMKIAAIKMLQHALFKDTVLPAQEKHEADATKPKEKLQSAVK